LLTRSSLPLGDISQQLAFSEPSTFHRSFKLWTGVAPGEYRRIHGTVQAGPECT
jgi:AraC-like DNA-binding protein